MSVARGREGGVRALVIGAVLLCAALPAGAHTRSVSYSSWEIDGREARVVFRIPQLQLTRLPWGIVSPPALAPELAGYLSGALRLEADGAVCPVVDGPRALQAPKERAVLEWRVRCATDGALAIQSEVLREVAPSHLHFARLRAGETQGGATERVLSTEASRWELASDEAGQEPAGSGFLEYLWLGVEHIATGVDHLVFLLGLLLLAGRVREVITIVTGFTVAHSITLALAALGQVRPDGAAVEALIGLSIALVAIENAWVLAGRPRGLPWVVVGALLAMGGIAAFGVGAIPAVTSVGLAVFAGCYFAMIDRAENPRRLRAAVAFCFGLIHGFGFAGVLAELSLPTGRLVPALFGFNVGVEVGQLAIVAVVWPLLRAASRVHAGSVGRLVTHGGTALVCALGVFWLVERAYG